MSNPRPPRHFLEGQPILEQPGIGFLRRHLGTWSDICFRPSAFFSYLSPNGPFSPTGFAVFCIWLGTVLGTFWNLLAVESLWLTLQEAGTTGPMLDGSNPAESPRWMQELLLGQEQMWLELPRVQNQLWTTLLLAPFVAYFTLHLVAGLLHFTLQPFRVQKEEPVPFEATFRYTAYAMAPMVLCGVPAFGGVGSFWTWIVLGIAMSRLHRLRWLGTVSSVWLPVLFLSLLWNQEILPRIAPPIAERLDLAWQNATPDEIRSKIKILHEKSSFSSSPRKAEAPPSAPPSTASDADAGFGSEYPPMPAFDRDHRVETREVDGFWQSERVFRSSRGALRIYHRARQLSDERTAVQIRIHHEGQEALALEVAQPPLGVWRPKSAHAASRGAPASLPAARAHPQAAADARIVGPWTAFFPRLEPGAQALFTFEVEPARPPDVLQLGPTLGVTEPGAPE